MTATRGAVVLGCLLAASVVVAALGGSSSHADTNGPALAGVLIAVGFGASGLIARSLRPDNHIGTMLVSIGFGFVVGNLELSDIPVLYSLGLAFDVAWIGLLIHVLAIFPTATFDSTVARYFAGIGWLTTVGLQLSLSVVSDPATQGCDACPDNLFAIASNQSAAGVLGVIQGPVLGSVTVVLGVATFVIRWRWASTIGRRAIVPPLASGMAALVLLAAAAFLEETGGVPAVIVDLAAGMAVFAIPASLLLGVLRANMTHSRIGELATRLTSTLEPDQLRSSLAWALEDPSLTIAYWAPQLGYYIDGNGDRLGDLEAPERATHTIEHDGQPIAALIYDPALDNNPSAIEAVAATANLALENQRLRAELRAQLAVLHDSRARIIAAEDAERRRLERNLHDGAQQRLLGVGLTLQHARSHLDGTNPAVEVLDEADTELRHAITELRDLAHGLHPAVLTESGLEAAIAALARRASCPVTVEYRAPEVPKPVAAVAYYVVSEALVNIAKHAEPTSAGVEISHRAGHLTVAVTDDGTGGADPDGTGLTGLADRVAAVHGTLTVHSPPGAGTRINARMPCE